MTPVYSAVVYLFGFIGLAGIGLLPLRAWQAWREVFAVAHAARSARIASLVVALVAMVALVCEVNIVGRVFRCLTSAYCGPGIASGWIYLAMFGVVYAMFEAVALLLRWMTRASRPVA